jgi:F-type H+-transporting ATPase subunit gamma
MATLKDIKNRIHSVKNTTKITNAMKLVSAAKFARASQAVNSARPYSKAFEELVVRVSGSAAKDHPLVAKKPVKTSLYIMVTTDRGLCGPLNSNVCRFAAKLIAKQQELGVKVKLATWGRKGTEYVRKLNNVELLESKEKVSEKPNADAAKVLGRQILDWYEQGTADEIHLIFPKFESALAQTPQAQQLLPIQLPVDKPGNSTASLIEPDPATLLNSLLRRRLTVQVYQSLLEANASEHGSRMSAMDSATNNAKEVNRKLTIQYNRARQAAITTELIEITSGASALAN